MFIKPLIITDWDCTIAEPTDRSFYAQHRKKTEEALAKQYDLTRERLKEITETMDLEKIRLEKLFSLPSLAHKFNLSSSKLGHYQTLVDSLEEIDTNDWFEENNLLASTIKTLNKHFNIVILSNSPAGLIRSIGSRIGFDMDNDFIAMHCLTAEKGSPKFVDASGAFQEIVNKYNPDIEKSWSIGDTPLIDLDPALKLGFNTALVNNLNKDMDDQKYTLSGSIQDVLKGISSRLIR